MKKLVILGTAILALNAVASEVQLKGGVDLNRRYELGSNSLGDDYKLKNGTTLGAEYIFDNQGEFEWGVGGEHKLSNGSGKLVDKSDKTKKIGTSTSMYALGKFNVVTTESGNDALYLLGRAGYGFVNESKELAALGTFLSGGVYGALGVGTEFGPVSFEALYERQNLKSENALGNIQRNKVDTFGLRLGYRFGRLVNDRKPEVVTVTKEVIKEVLVEKPCPDCGIKQPMTKTLPFSCSATEEKCVIRGFKVDGRVPNADEAADLKTIADVINQFAEGGSIDFIGHTDSTGSDAYNQKLSVARSQNVARLLREYGLKNSIYYGTITGKGESQPADTNNTVEGRYNNRRVELFFRNVDFKNVKFIDAN